MLISMTVEVPPYQHFLWPALQAVIALGGSASIAELDAAVIDRENLVAPRFGIFIGEIDSALGHYGDDTGVDLAFGLRTTRPRHGPRRRRDGRKMP